MKKIQIGVILFLLLTMAVVGGVLPVSAENTIHIDRTEMKYLSEGTTYHGDLNKDGFRETLHVYQKNGKSELYINGRKALSAKTKDIVGFAVLDLNKKADYLVVYEASLLPSKGNFYGYNGKKLYKIATGLYGDGKILPNKIADNGHDFWIDQPRNGTYVAYAGVGGFRSGQGYGGYVKAKLKFKIKNKKMVFQADAEHELVMNSFLDGEENNYKILPKASGKMDAYNKPAIKGVRKNFTLQKGERYTYLKVKFSDPYSFIQIKREKTGQTGWVVVKRSQLKIDFNPDF